MSFNILGTQLASTDADGVVKLWDTRMTAEVATINTGKRLWRMGRQIGKRNERARIWVWVWVWVNAGVGGTAEIASIRRVWWVGARAFPTFNLTQYPELERGRGGRLVGTVGWCRRSTVALYQAQIFTS